KNWLEMSAVGCALGLAFWTLFKLVTTAGRWQEMIAVVEPLEDVRNLPALVDPFYRVTLGVAFILLLARVVGAGLSFRIAMLTAGLVVSAIFYAVPQMAAYPWGDSLRRADLEFVRGCLNDHQEDAQEPPTIYWPGCRLDYVWLDLRVRHYYDLPRQMAPALL